MKKIMPEGIKPTIIIVLGIVVALAIVVIGSIYVHGHMSNATEPEVVEKSSSVPLHIEFDGESYPVVAGVISNEVTDTVWVESTAKPGSVDKGTVVIMANHEPQGDITVTTEDGDFHYVITSRHPKVSPGSTEWRTVGNKSFNRSFGEENLVVMIPHRETYTIVIAEPQGCCSAIGE